MRTIRLSFIAVITVLTLGLLSAACGDDTTSSSTTNSDGVSQGVGSQDATKDVVFEDVTLDSLGIATPHLIVTNNSSKRSDYYIEANVVKQGASGDGPVVDYTNAVVSNLDPGAVAEVDMVGVVDWQADYKVVITEVQRTAAA